MALRLVLWSPDSESGDRDRPAAFVDDLFQEFILGASQDLNILIFGAVINGKEQWAAFAGVDHTGESRNA